MKRSVTLLSALYLAACATSPSEPMHNTLSATEVASGWDLLFDGESTDGWRNYKSDEHGEEWQVIDGTLTLTERGGGHILSEETYRNFELSLDWKISPGGNSGIFFHVLEGPEDKIYWTGPEYQLLDNSLDLPLDQMAGSLFVLYPVSHDATNPAGEFNHTRIRVVDGQVEYWLNEAMVLSYDLNSSDFARRVADSKFADKARFGKTGRGHIALQDHGDPVSFRNIKIRRLDD